jgi:hypothetical protein
MSVSVWVADAYDPYSALHMNVSNDRFASIMTMIGVEDYRNHNGVVGEFTNLDDIIGRCTYVLQMLDAYQRQGINLDGGRAPVEIPNPGRCRVIDGGQSDGYYTLRVSQLLGLAAIAKAMRKKLIYG